MTRALGSVDYCSAETFWDSPGRATWRLKLDVLGDAGPVAFLAAKLLSRDHLSWIEKKFWHSVTFYDGENKQCIAVNINSAKKRLKHLGFSSKNVIWAFHTDTLVHLFQNYLPKPTMIKPLYLEKLRKYAPALRNEDLEKIVLYVQERKAVFPKQTIVHPQESGLVRSVLFTPSKGVFLLLNRVKSCQDTLVGEGTFKKVTLAFNLFNGVFYASAAMNIAASVAEISNMKKLEGENGFLQLIDHTAYEDKNGKKRARIILELCPAGDLCSSLMSNRVTEIDRKTLFCEIVQIVAALHQKEFVHRDIKPENIFLFRGQDGRLHAKLGDFALMSYDGCGTMTIRCTPRYMAPELAKVQFFHTVVKSVDMWALGLTLYGLLTGKRLSFTTKSQEANYAAFCSKLQNLQQSELPQRPLNKKSPRYLVYKMLKINPEKRITASAAQKMLPSLQWQL